MGRAADIRIPGVQPRELLDYCRSLDHVGCGYYPNATFVHIDVREVAAVWVDLSLPGRPAQYVTSPRAWLERHR